ncbi:MAG: Fur family transcriptional regulator [Candidatus Omnitrophota bacterium]
MRVTYQKLAVFKVLAEEKKHLTAEEICGKIRIQFPSVSLATVYSILELFKENCLVSGLRIKFDKSYFEARIASHHHFLCNLCGRIIDIDLLSCSTIAGMQVEGHKIHKFQSCFYVHCKEWRDK